MVYSRVGPAYGWACLVWISTNPGVQSMESTRTDIMKLQHPPRIQVGKRGHHKTLHSFSFGKMESQFTSPFAMTLQFLQVITSQGVKCYYSHDLGFYCM